MTLNDHRFHALSLTVCILISVSIFSLSTRLTFMHLNQFHPYERALCKCDAPFSLMIKLGAKDSSFVQTSMNEMFTFSAEQLSNHGFIDGCMFALHASLH